ncbi:MAG: hypothetical protein SWK76_17070 [Actinomycetota bacterium]|nr:hypothetical protein [Actinomycetota bacterium]
MSCTCQECGKRYKVDFIVDDDLWERIKPDGKEQGAGLLCGSCILRKIEALDEYSAVYATCYMDYYEGFDLSRYVCRRGIREATSMAYCDGYMLGYRSGEEAMD